MPHKRRGIEGLLRVTIRTAPRLRVRRKKAVSKVKRVCRFSYKYLYLN